MYVWHVYETCICQIHYKGHLYGTCMGYLYGIRVCDKCMYATHVIGKYITWDTYMGHVCDKYLYGTRMWNMYLANTLYRTIKRYMCVWKIPIWDTYVGQVFFKYIIWDTYIGHMCDKYMYLYGTYMWDMNVTNMYMYMGHVCQTCICDMHLENTLYGIPKCEMFLTTTSMGYLFGICISRCMLSP